MMKQILARLSTPGEEPPFWQELWSAFYDTYVKSNAEYENLAVGPGYMISLRTVIFGLFVALTVAVVISTINRRALTLFVRRLLKDGILSAETAKSLPELGLADRLWLRRAVRKSVSLRRVVICREEEEYLKTYDPENVARRLVRHNPDFRINPDEHHFYIPEEQKYAADVRFDKKGGSWLGAVALMVLLLISLILILVALPYVMETLNEFVGSFGSSGAENIVT